MPISHDDIDGVKDLALRIRAYVRSIAPCVLSLPDNSEEKEEAVAILKNVAAEIRARGSRSVKSQAVGPARVDYVAVASVVTVDDERALRALCGGSAGPSAAPRGSFPLDLPISGIWPERY